MLSKRALFYYPILLLFLSLLFTNSLASEIDSLVIEFEKSHELRKRIELSTQLAMKFQDINQDSSLHYAIFGEELSVNTNNSEYLGELYAILGNLDVKQDSLNKAQLNYEKAVIYFTEQNNDKGLTAVKILLGNIALFKDKLLDAYMYYQQSLVHAKKSGRESAIPVILINIGAIHSESGEHLEAINYYDDAILVLQKTNDSVLLADAYSNIGSSYLAINDIMLSKEYFNKALLIYAKLDSPNSMAFIYYYLAKSEYIEDYFNKSLASLKISEQSLKLPDRIYAGPKEGLLTDIYELLGNNYEAIQIIDSAEIFYKKALNLALNNNIKSNISSLALSISSILYLNGLSDSAYYYSMLHNAYADSLNKEDNIRKLSFLKAKTLFEKDIEIEKQKAELQMEQERRKFLSLLVFALALLLILSVLFLLLRLSKSKMKGIELEKKNLSAELELRNKELTTHVLTQLKNNEFILAISEKLKETLLIIPKEHRHLVNNLIKEIEFESSQESWKDFEIRFEQVYSSFYENLAKQFPDLTSNDLRLCAFLRLNMNSKDIAAITYQSLTSINVARWRLRQKFGLEKDENLVTFLLNF